MDEAVVKAEHAQDQVMIAGITELAEELSNLIISTAGSELCSISEPIGESPSFPANFDEYSSYSDLLGADDPSDVPPAISDSSSPNFIVEKKHGEDIPSLPADDEELISSYPTADDPSDDPPKFEISPPVVESEIDVFQVKSSPDVDTHLIVQLSDPEESHKRVDDDLPKSDFEPGTSVSAETETELVASNEQGSM
jgi:hypothetical protein